MDLGNVESSETHPTYAHFPHTGCVPPVIESSGWFPGGSLKVVHTFPKVQHEEDGTILKLGHQNYEE